MVYKDMDSFDPTNSDRLLKVGIARNGAAIYRRAESGKLHQEYGRRDWWGKQGMEDSVKDEMNALHFGM